METAEAFRIDYEGGHLVEGQRRGVARDDTISRDDGAELLVDLFLDPDVLENGLDDDVHVLEVRRVLGNRDDPSHDGVNGLLEALLFRHAGENLLNEILPRLEGRCNVLHNHGDLGVPEDLNDDAPAHGAEAQDGHLLEGLGLKSLRHHVLRLIRQALDEEGIDAALRLGSHDHLGEVVPFNFQTFVEGDFKPPVHGIQSQHGTRDLAALGGLEYPLLCHVRHGIDLGEILGRPLQVGLASEDLRQELLRLRQEVSTGRDQPVDDAHL